MTRTLANAFSAWMVAATIALGASPGASAADAHRMLTVVHDTLPDELARRAQVVRLNPLLPTALADAAPADLQLELFEDALTVHLQAPQWAGPGHFTRTGTIGGISDSTVIVAVNGDLILMNIWAPGLGSFELRRRGDEVILSELDPASFDPCGFDDDAPELNGPPADGGVAGDCAPDDGSVIEVLVVYTPQARLSQGGVVGINTLINLAAVSTNNAYANSGIATTIHIAAMLEIDYVESNSGSTDLNALTGTNDGQMDEVHALRDFYGADLVSMIVSNISGICGIAHRAMQFSNSPLPWLGFNVVRASCAVGNLTFAHELGHNQGCLHDRASSPGRGAFTYSHGYDPGTVFRTIMGVTNGGVNRVPYFSNPDVLFGGIPMGVPIDDPDSAHNALTLDGTALNVANFRPSSDCNCNGIPDDDEVVDGTADDCNANGSPDECDVAGQGGFISVDCNNNGTPDECETDCNGNGVFDACDVDGGGSDDCNGNGIPDECENDCNDNGIDDACDIASGTSDDVNNTGIPDECETPGNDSCGAASPIGLGVTPFSSAGATSAANDDVDCGVSQDLWYRIFNLECEGPMTVSLCDSSFDTSLAIYETNCPSGPGRHIACNDNFCGNRASVTFEAELFKIYRIRIGSSPGALTGTGNGNIEIFCGGVVAPVCPTDTNNDGVTNVDDLVAVILDWGTNGAVNGGDVDGNGEVNVDDLVNVILAWGPCD